MTKLSSSELAEDAFYAAFASCSVQDMGAVWAEADVVCIHPGAPALVGHTAVMNSWARILTAGDSVDIEYERVTRMATDDIAVHVVREILIQNDGRVEVTATNIYRCLEGAWKMIEHHGSQAMAKTRATPSSTAVKRTLQ